LGGVPASRVDTNGARLSGDVAVRVTGGALRGRRIRVPRSAAVRPTSDRVREALFARLGDLEDARVLDLFGGSGALGIEALSRGAAHCVFVERSPAVAAALQANLDALGVQGRAHVVRGEAAAALRRLGDAGGERFHLALLDPPYAEPETAARALRALATSGILAPRATVVVEASRHGPLQPVEGLIAVDERRYGDTVIHRFELDEGASR
jgi:16S rRNA (guanine966-N2)-methyltransferase